MTNIPKVALPLTVYILIFVLFAGGGHSAEKDSPTFRLGIGYSVADGGTTILEALPFDGDADFEIKALPESCFTSPGVTRVNQNQLSNDWTLHSIILAFFRLGAPQNTIYCGDKSVKIFPLIEYKNSEARWQIKSRPSNSEYAIFINEYMDSFIKPLGWTSEQHGDVVIVQRGTGENIVAFAVAEETLYAGYFFSSEANRERFLADVQIEEYEEIESQDRTSFIVRTPIMSAHASTLSFWLWLGSPKAFGHVLDVLDIEFNSPRNERAFDERVKLLDIMQSRFNVK
jgi:hypothetical protein